MTTDKQMEIEGDGDPDCRCCGCGCAMYLSGDRTIPTDFCDGCAQELVPILLAACKAALDEIAKRRFVAGCIDDAPSAEWRRLSDLSDRIRAAIARAEGTPTSPG